MKKFFAIMALLAFIAMPNLVKAKDNDIATISCEEFINGSEEEIAYMIFWIDGYLSFKSGDTTMSNAYIEQLGTHLGTFCEKNPKKTIMDAMKAFK